MKGLHASGLVPGVLAGYNGIENAVYRTAPLTDYVVTSMSLPIDHGTWFLQWVASNGDLTQTFTSRTFKIN